jgi:hypothetical protein
MSDVARDKIIDRVRKLLALAGNNTSDAERDAAMQKAQALLIEHKISESEVAATDSDTRIAEWVLTGRNGQWARRVAQAIGKLYFCGYISASMGKKVQHIFVGSEADATVAREITSFVVESVYREGAKQMRARGANTSYWTSFVNAASLRIAQRVRDMIADSQRASTTTSATQALVVTDLYQKAQDAARAYITNDPNIKTAVGRPMHNPSSEGWRAGVDFGNAVPITQLLTSGPKRLK